MRLIHRLITWWASGCVRFYGLNACDVQATREVAGGFSLIRESWSLWIISDSLSVLISVTLTDESLPLCTHFTSHFTLRIMCLATQVLTLYMDIPGYPTKVYNRISARVSARVPPTEWRLYLFPRSSLCSLAISRKKDMAEAPSNRYVTRSTISEATTASRSGPRSLDTDGMICPGTIEMDLLLCDYVKLRKARRGAEKTKKTKIDKKLQVRTIANCHDRVSVWHIKVHKASKLLAIEAYAMVADLILALAIIISDRHHS